VHQLPFENGTSRLDRVRDDAAATVATLNDLSIGALYCALALGQCQSAPFTRSAWIPSFSARECTTRADFSAAFGAEHFLEMSLNRKDGSQEEFGFSETKPLNLLTLRLPVDSPSPR